ncbi:MAG: hypothetical protein JJU12_05230 [Chlamydiales bacterium]|nr:hypothetical protein [Chlamydiales bacterium]
MKGKFLSAILILTAGFSVGYGFVSFLRRYDRQEEMYLPVRELSCFEYPDNPDTLSAFYGRYDGRICRLVYKGGSRFDLVFLPSFPQTAICSFKDIDLSLFIPAIPKWVKGDRNLEAITLFEQEWNRQQVSFSKQEPQLVVEGGDGFEQEFLYTAELARNSLNAGLWEVLLFSFEAGEKRLLYQGWFTFPLGYYKKIFEENNHLSYWAKWLRLERWFPPTRKKVNLDKLRTVLAEDSPNFEDLRSERVIAEGEQLKKTRLMKAKRVIRWGDFTDFSNEVSFVSFESPGYYDVRRRQGNQLARFATLKTAVHRKIRSPGSNTLLDELELEFEKTRFILGGVNLASLPRLDEKEYPKGFCMPIGICVPPFYQSYEELRAHRPDENTYYCLLLDNKGRWLNHQKIGISGPVLFRDAKDPALFHLFFLSYERISLVKHVAFRLKEDKDFDRVIFFRNEVEI